MGKRGILFTFDNPYKTNVYAIITKQRIFICDTFLGPEPMAEIMHYLKEKVTSNKELIIFNSHADYDHVWGNIYFKDNLIIAHKQCREILEKEGKIMLKVYENHQRGNVEIKLPNVLFETSIYFPEDEIFFFHSPGHTLESSSCYDSADNILFVGDNIEKPLPYINFLNFDEYINTLESYLSFNAKVVISGHNDPLFTNDLILENIDYIKNLKRCTVDINNLSNDALEVHLVNLNQLVLLYNNNNDNNSNKEKCTAQINEIKKDKK